jgi:hypothetical protein
MTKDHIIILPHAEEYRHLYDISVEDVLLCLNEPDAHEGLATDLYTAEKNINSHCIYIYYYKTFPLRAKPNEVYAIIDFIGYSTDED